MFEDQDIHSVPSISIHSRLERDILKVLLYFDVFNHPVKAEEIYSFLPSNSTNPVEIARQCQTFPLNEYIAEEQGMYFLLARKNSVHQRLEKESRAYRRWNIALVMAHIIRRFPFVRGIFVSGELSKGVASKEGDIDFVIVTAENRLWICRTLLILFKKIFLLNKKKYYCLNHFVSENHLEFEVRNVYSAIEVATLKPLYNFALFEKYMNANSWVSEFLPNWEFIEQRFASVISKPSILQRLLELPFADNLSTRFDAWLMERWRDIWKKRYSYLPDEKRDHLFQCSSFISTAYGEDFLNKILSSYEKRLAKFGIQNLEEEDLLLPVYEK
ncbi:MAG: hypothetical protein HY088_05795 [Ignavibacteriales bacterium]|nr:hypothetical protein [Ignavibacteriales bacterium]